MSRSFRSWSVTAAARCFEHKRLSGSERVRVFWIDRRIIEEHACGPALSATAKAAWRGLGPLHHAGYGSRVFRPQGQTDPLAGAATMLAFTGRPRDQLALRHQD